MDTVWEAMGRRYSSGAGGSQLTAGPGRLSSKSWVESPIKQVCYLALLALGGVAVTLGGLSLLDAILSLQH